MPDHSVLAQQLHEQFTAAANTAADELLTSLTPEQARWLLAEEPNASQPLTVAEQTSLRGRLRAMLASGTDALGAYDPIKRPNGEAYLPRRVPNIGCSDVELLHRYRAANRPILFKGFPGCGKTALCEAAFGEDLITVNAHAEMEPHHLFGGYIKRADGQTVWADGPVTQAMKEGRPLFVDDITLIPPGTNGALYPLLDGRGRLLLPESPDPTTPITAAKGFYVVGAHNPGAPGAVLSEALASRFGLTPRLITDFRVARALGAPRKLIDLVRELQGMRDREETMWAPEIREMLAFMRNAELLGSTTAAAENLLSVCPDEDRDLVLPVVARVYPVTGELAF